MGNGGGGVGADGAGGGAAAVGAATGGVTTPNWFPDMVELRGMAPPVPG
jgi:hypothetical protein